MSSFLFCCMHIKGKSPTSGKFQLNATAKRMYSLDETNELKHLITDFDHIYQETFVVEVYTNNEENIGNYEISLLNLMTTKDIFPLQLLNTSTETKVDCEFDFEEYIKGKIDFSLSDITGVPKSEDNYLS